MQLVPLRRGPVTVRTDLTVVGGEVKVALSLCNLFDLRDERAAMAENGGKPLVGLHKFNPGHP
jgi:hypothetical protein